MNFTNFLWILKISAKFFRLLFIRVGTYFRIIIFSGKFQEIRAVYPRVSVISVTYFIFH